MNRSGRSDRSGKDININDMFAENQDEQVEMEGDLSPLDMFKHSNEEPADFGQAAQACIDAPVMDQKMPYQIQIDTIQDSFSLHEKELHHDDTQISELEEQ